MAETEQTTPHENGSPHPRHDSFFRAVFCRPERTASLLRLAARRNGNLARFIDTVNLDTLREIPENFTDEADTGSADLAFTVELRGKGKGSAKLLVGLLEEHKSYRDDRVFRQLIRYWHGIMVLKQGNIPTVALILYNGERPWKPDTESLFPDYPEYYHQIRLPMIVEFIDVGRDFDGEETRGLDPATIFALLIMKHAFGTEELQEYYGPARDALMEMPPEERNSLVRKSIVYLSKVFRPEQKELLMDYVTHQDVYGEPSLYDVLQEEGREKGLREGEARGLREGKAEGLREGAVRVARKMLALHRPVNEVAEISCLTEAEVRKLRDTAETNDRHPGL